MAKKSTTTSPVDTAYPAKKTAKSKLVLKAPTTSKEEIKESVESVPATEPEFTIQQREDILGDKSDFEQDNTNIESPSVKPIKIKKEPVTDLSALAGVLQDKGIVVPEVEEVPIVDKVVNGNKGNGNSPLPVEGKTKTPFPAKVTHTTREKPVHDKGARANSNYSRPYQGKINNEFRNNGAVERPLGISEHAYQLVLLMKNNAEIRRYTALGILNYLLQKGEIRGAGRFVDFKWNKFTVKTGHLVKDYEYTSSFFINCLVAAFSSFASSSQITIDKFLTEESDVAIADIYNEDEVQFIVNSNQGR